MLDFVPDAVKTTFQCLKLELFAASLTALKKSRIMQPAGFGTTIANDPIWDLEGLHLNRNWPWWPEFYY